MRRLFAMVLMVVVFAPALRAQQFEPTTPPEWRSDIDYERQGLHDANRIRTLFYNFGMVGDYQTNPDLSIFHSVEVPKGSGVNYSDGVTPFVLTQLSKATAPDEQFYIMLTGFRERQAQSPVFAGKQMRFEPRPGFFEPDPNINKGRSIAISNDPRTWPGAVDAAGNPRGSVDPTECWYDKINDPDDPGWCGSWNGFFGKRANADQESYSVMDDDQYFINFVPDSRDSSRNGLGLRVEVRGFQWANPQAQDVIFWHYDIVNESTTDYDDMIFGLYMDSGVGGAQISCDGVAESDDDNARFDKDFGLNLVYTWDEGGRGVGLQSTCQQTGYLGYAYLETPGNAVDGIDNDEDGITDERRDGGPGQKIEGQEAIRTAVQARYDIVKFEVQYGPLEERAAYRAGVWWTGDEDLDWVAEFSDTGADGIFTDDHNPADTGEGDGMPTEGEANFDRTDITESDQIGLTGFKLNRIRPGGSANSSETDNIVFFTNENEWPRRLYEQFTNGNPDVRFDETEVHDYNIGFLFASGPFTLKAGRRERFSLALAFGADLTELEDNVSVVQSIYNANYQFATPPPPPVVRGFSQDGRVTLVWDNEAEEAADPVTGENDFEGYRIYRATDPNFLDAQKVFDARGNGPLGNGRPIAQFDLKNGIRGFSDISVQGVQYWLGDDSGLVHTWTDSTVTNGQTYYYAVTAYDRGSEKFNFYPSENSMSISRTLRGGTILPVNVVQARPEGHVPGYIPAQVQDGSVRQVAGNGVGSLDVRILNSAQVPDAHTFRIEFKAPSDSIRATSYRMTDLTTDEVLFESGTDLSGLGVGPVGAGVLPVLTTLATPEVDTLASGFTSESHTNAVLRPEYQHSISINRRRPGYPDSLLISFGDTPLDTSLAAIGQPATPANFKITTADGGRQFDFRFEDSNGDHTLSADGDFIDVLMPVSEGSSQQVSTWRIFYDADRSTGASDPPGAGDVYELVLQLPFGPGDAFEFMTSGERVDPDLARTAFGNEKPYVVPNPYVASASFEPERFAQAGRGERRLEFRAIPAGATVRIYSLRGELVQTLHQDESTVGMVPWNLRTKDNLEVAPGLYIFHVESDAGEYTGKFAIIK
ncbi:MAG TPA: T9SS type A sorting domain-containing protein [Rhodothermales bacterium]|nr:T9SS type A sorting domain-containing protein [Rhodothermales bacterium]